MKKYIGIDAGNYSFNVGTNTLTLSNLGFTLKQENLILITNVTMNTIVYNFAAGPTATVSGNNIILTSSTVGMNSTDKFHILVDDGVYDQYDSFGNLKIINNNLENPFHTKHGQMVTSEAENFWARLARRGGRINGGYVCTALGNVPGVYTQHGIGSSPPLGTVFFPKTASVSCTVDAILGINAGTGLQGVNGYWPRFNFVKAGTVLSYDFDGEIMCNETSGLNITGSPILANSNGIITGGLCGISIDRNYIT